jgi:hypothetical protein
MNIYSGISFVVHIFLCLHNSDEPVTVAARSKV